MTTKAERLEQFSVFLRNRPGVVADLCTALTEQHIDIRAVSVLDTIDIGILRMIVDDPEKAKSALETSGAAYMVASVVGLAIKNTPGGFTNVVRTMADHGVNIEYVYASAISGSEHTLGVFRVDDVDKALDIEFP